MKIHYNLTTILLAFFVYSCGTNSGSKTEEKTAEELREEKTMRDIEKLLQDMPPPSLVPFTLKSIGAPLDKVHINGLYKMQSYVGNRDKLALNMGVYASDISYLAAYGHEEECIEYLKTAHKMAEILGDSAIFGQDEVDEFEGHVVASSDEEIAKLLSKMFLKTSLQMEQDHHLTMAGLALAGSFVEGLYQAVITIETYPNTEKNQKLLEPLINIVLGEQQALRDIIAVLEDLPFDETIAEISTELSILDKLYEGDLKEVEEKMKEDPNFIVNKNMMRDITIEVKRIRESIVI
ncbi:MAG: hypothetical protein AAF789_02840 [Bacteroidota bacterium]